jgi:AcrR family transcriptional regulator
MTDDAPLRAVHKGEPPHDGRLARGARSREAALTAAVQLASVEGLEGLSISRLAERLGAAKSSVHAMFRAKEVLQVAAIGRTREMLIDLVVAPALAAEPGIARLRSLGELWFAYLAGDVFEGGCLLCSASAEMDGRPGATRDAVATVMQEWLQFLAENVKAAIDAGELAPHDPEQVAFELNAIGMAANWHHQLFGGTAAFANAQTAWNTTLYHLTRSPK